jgi:predicted RNase H-like HicB family nuclease
LELRHRRLGAGYSWLWLSRVRGPLGRKRKKFEDGPLQRQFDVVIERDEEGYYVATLLQLPGCHTQARSMDEVTERIREAVELRLEVEGAPEQVLEFAGIQRISVAA